MKFLLSVVLLTAISLSLSAQKSACSKFKNGKFKNTYNGHTAVIVRSDAYQTEYIINQKDSLKMVFNVKWVDDCSYTLTPTQQTLAQYTKIPKNALITVKMSNVTDSSYTETSTSNFVAKTIVSEMIRVR